MADPDSGPIGSRLLLERGSDDQHRWQGFLARAANAAASRQPCAARVSGSRQQPDPVHDRPRPRPQEVTQMLDGRFPVEVVRGVPIVAAPEEIDITNADRLRSALLQAAAAGNGTFVVDMSRT